MKEILPDKEILSKEEIDKAQNQLKQCKDCRNYIELETEVRCTLNIPMHMFPCRYFRDLE